MFGTPKVPVSATPVTTAPDLTTKISEELSQTKPPGVFSSGLDKAGEYLSPNRGMPTQDAILAKAGEIQTTAAAKGLELTGAKALEMATAELTPGMISRYAPLALAGTAVFGAAGGFETPKEELSGSPFGIRSQELYDQNPSKYSVFAGYNMPTPMSRVSQPVEKDDRDYIFQSYLQPQYAAEGGAMNRQGQRNMALEDFPRRQGYIAGPGTETSDDIPAMLSDGEFVMTARAVRGLGDGSRKRGVKKMYDMMRAFEGGVVA